ncbi:MAG: hypothetical protein A3C47_02360 [Omnitrophica bacterium RIFCSPHIGHO2_02_FULL_51_18]|nr:MAG: hypothetical protein A3C47_02360 [Omnitrophica bacterium RIFCSPHIGHO2_02_FULL_51_18]
MFPKTTLAFLTVSLGVHAFFAAALYTSPFIEETEEQEPVQIEYIQSKPAPVSVVEAKKPLKPTAEKPAEKAAEAVSKPKEAAAQRRITPPKELPAQRKPGRKPIHQPVLSPKPAAAVWRSEDLLADPEKGRVFASYFAKIKEKIQNIVQRKYSYQNIGDGSVTLLFVLDSDGSLERVSVLEKQSTGDSHVKDFAMQCVRDSAPFGRFPKDLNLGKISFNLTILFEEI